MSREWRERLGAILGSTILISMLVMGLVLGFGLILTLPVAVIAAAAAPLGDSRQRGVVGA
jgi:CBS-domain-containing membrane protein